MLTHRVLFNLESIQMLGFVLALLISYIITPLIRARAFKLGLLDKPSERRIHEAPVPRLGGVSIYISLFLTSLILIAAYLNYKAFSTGAFPLIAILAGGTIIFLLGLLDDIDPMPARYKLTIQVLAASVAWYLGVKINHIVNPFYHCDFFLFKLSIGESIIHFDPFLSYLLTIIWIVGITNAINLIDGIDGLATGLALISAITIWSVSLGQRIGELAGALMSATLAGSLLGFLRWNFNPARIFLGDSGAYLTGFVLSSLAVTCVMKSLTLAIMTPMLILIFAVPIADTLFAIIRRTIKRKSILEPDKEHLHHRILAFGISQKITSYLLYFISAMLSFTATCLMSTKASLRFLVISGVVISIGLFYTLIVNWKHQKIFRNIFKSEG